jgi:hypothetical protein
MDKHATYNRRAALIQERMQTQRMANSALRDGAIGEAVRHQKRALELNIQVQQLTLEVFRENTGETTPATIAMPVRVAS